MAEYGQEIEVFTFTGWEPFDWCMYDSAEEAYAFLESCGKTRVIKTDLDEKGKASYETDLMKRPNYQDGSKRTKWSELGGLEKSSWIKR